MQHLVGLLHYFLYFHSISKESLFTIMIDVLVRDLVHVWLIDHGAKLRICKLTIVSIQVTLKINW